MSTLDLHLFGIRHHGPGSARSLQQALARLEPDIVLVEGPPEADGIIPLLADPAMEPPIALLVYRPDEPKRAAYYPFAIFSPEIQALRYALTRAVPARFIDLPHTYRLARPPEKPGGSPEQTLSPSAQAFRTLAEASGYDDYETWWNHVVEQRQDSSDLFAAIEQVMAMLRLEAELLAIGQAPSENDLFEARREAHMRSCIRQAQAEGYQRMAVVCGAWHTAALANMPSARTDSALLRGLPQVEVAATWVPWTYGRLAVRTGYGAGIQSPGWYHHLWEMGQQDKTASEMGIHWLTRVAHLLREQDLDASSANVIEAVRLSEALATLRQRPLPGLLEFNEAVQTILCFGDDRPMQLIRDRLIVGERMGSVPPDTPMVPLQRDLQQLQKRLRLYPDPQESVLTLDLRQPLHLERSHLLHRLRILGIPWGQSEPVQDKQGTFLELWRMRWQPDFAVLIIEAGMWGTTIVEAAAELARDKVQKATRLPQLTTLLNEVILADLPDVILPLMAHLENIAALSSDVGHMMEALPPLARVLRYGSVRQTDTKMVGHVVDGLVTRICIGLPSTCASLNDAAAAEMYPRLMAMNSVVKTLQKESHQTTWQAVLQHLADQQGLHGLIAGRACRLLFDAGLFDTTAVVKRMQLALSTAQAASASPGALLLAAFWIEGFLKGSGILLIHDETLWQVLDEWVRQLSEERFMTQLPLLRRTFSTFSQAERRQIYERVKGGMGTTAVASTTFPFDSERASLALPLISQLLGLKANL